MYILYEASIIGTGDTLSKEIYLIYIRIYIIYLRIYISKYISNISTNIYICIGTCDTLRS